MIKKLIALANRLDELGFIEEANELDEIIKDSGLADWFKPKPQVCECKCDGCKYARDLPGRPTLQKKYHCGQNQCKIVKE